MDFGIILYKCCFDNRRNCLVEKLHYSLLFYNFFTLKLICMISALNNFEEQNAVLLAVGTPMNTGLLAPSHFA